VCRLALGPTQPLVRWVPGVLSPGLKRKRGVTLTTHPHLVPRSRMSRSYTLPTSAFVECRGTALALVVYRQRWREANVRVVVDPRSLVTSAQRASLQRETERRARVVSIPYSGVTGLKSRPAYRLSSGFSWFSRYLQPNGRMVP
jgi:hypothetical protein